MDDLDSDHTGAVISVLLCEPRPRLAIGLATVLQRCRAIEVVGRAETAEQLSTLVELHHPTVVVLDADWPGYDYLALCKQLSSRSIGVVVLAPRQADLPVPEVMAAGAHAVLPGRFRPRDPALAVAHAALSAGRQSALRMVPDFEPSIRSDQNLGTRELSPLLDWSLRPSADSISERLR